MRILSWILRIILFLALFLFALKNTATVSLSLYFDQTWQAPLIVVLLVFFAVGAAMGVLATIGTVFRQRRENSRLQRELQDRQREGSVAPPAADGDAGLRMDL